MPRLRAVTRALSVAPDIVALADPHDPLLWVRGDRGCVGVGELLRLTFSGPSRFDDAAKAWRSIADLAEIDDAVRLPGTGLMALGTFAFDARSSAESVLIVPRVLVAQHRGAAWITEISVLSGDDTDAGEPGNMPARDQQLPPAAPARSWPGTVFSATEQSLESYIGGVREAAARIERAEVEKVVLARQVRGTVTSDADLRVPLGRLADRYLDCWTFAVDGMVGASPETLIRSTEGAVTGRVLAGTRGRHPSDADRDTRARDELLTSSKEQHEHAFAVQSVITALSPYLRDLRTDDEPFALRLPNVWHLATDLGATLGERSSALELVGAMHPTAAVAGTPTADAIEMIAELEPFDRERYSGAVGWIDAAGDGEWVIALRCAQVGATDDVTGLREVVATAGGGIVEGSDPEHELGETVSKLRPITEAFAE